jgi:hypothetical protein
MAWLIKADRAGGSSCKHGNNFLMLMETGIGGNVYPRDVYPRNMGLGKCGLLWLNSLCCQVVSGYQIDEEGYAVLSKVHGSSSV